jgi:hypothetical protein
MTKDLLERCEGFNLWSDRSAYTSDFNLEPSGSEFIFFSRDRQVHSDLHCQTLHTFPAFECMNWTLNMFQLLQAYSSKHATITCSERP